jgi:protein SCO1/2
MHRLSLFFTIIFSLFFSATLIADVAESLFNVEKKSKGSIQKFQNKKALAESQAAIGNKLSNFRLTDASGKGLQLHQLQGKPLVLSLIFTSCHQTCPVTTRYLASVVEKARKTFGKDKFSVALLGFDSQFDSPQAMKSFSKKQGIEDADWYLLSADAKTIKAFTKELGFLFFSSPRGFDHMVQATIIDAEGVIYRQVYGEIFNTPLLLEPLKELLLGRPQPNQTLLADLINKVRFFCTNYDPASDSYHFDYSLFIGMFIGAIIIILIFLFLLKEVRRNNTSV